MEDFAIDISDEIAELEFIADNLDVLHMAIEEFSDRSKCYTNALFVAICALKNKVKQLDNMVEKEFARRRSEDGTRKGIVQGQSGEAGQAV